MTDINPQTTKHEEYTKLKKLLNEAVEQVRGMTPTELENMYQEQRKSWAGQDND